MKVLACTPTWIFHGTNGVLNRQKRRKMVSQFRAGLSTNKKAKESMLANLRRLSKEELANRQKAATIHYKEMEEYMVLLDLAMDGR